MSPEYQAGKFIGYYGTIALVVCVCGSMAYKALRRKPKPNIGAAIGWIVLMVIIVALSISY